MTLDSNTGAYYRMKSDRDETVKTLEKLNTGDFIMMTATIDTADGSVQVDTIDFVGLRRIIGFWATPNGNRLMNFKSYSELSIHDLIIQSNSDRQRAARRQMKYTVVPAQGQDWVMFLSDDHETQMGYLSLAGSLATLRLVHSRTGETTNVLQLQKIQE